MAEQEVLILRSGRYLDSAKIVTFFSREGGLGTGFARGATSRDNRFGASLEPLTRSRLSLRRGTLAGLARILHADVIASYPRIRTDYDRLVWAGLIVRFLLGFLPESHPEPSLFALACGALDRLDGRVGPPAAVWEGFARQALALLGWGIPAAVCRRCGRTGGEKEEREEAESHYFRASDGAVFCRSCRLAEGGGELWGVEAEVLNALSRNGGSVDEDVLSPGPGPLLRERLAFLDRVIGEHLPRWTPVAELTFVGSAISGFDGDRKLPPPRSEDEEVDPNGGGEHDQRT
uniref:DNA repair protein RecO n=1 Tax=Leptospirillum ferrodiazotrophum TaxID=412449 RepID=C6HW76_9BACT|nr:MAG: Recombination protein O (RecO) [Leptospirillum ferrodiazotrophum]